MKIVMRCLLLIGLVALAVNGQVQVYSEFARIDASGNAVAPENPREILSPALARNAFSSFQVVVQVPAGTKFQFYMGQNPEGAVKVTLYRRSGDKLQPVELPYFSEGTQILWMDAWVDADAPVRRVKLEPQVYVDGDWVIYPMEARVTETVVPSHTVAQTGTAHPWEVMRAFVCGGKPRPLSGQLPPGAEFQYRNAQQDVALATSGARALRDDLKRIMGGCEAKPAADPEAYLRLRDVFFSPAAKASPPQSVEKKVQ
jgi:hypothetical protein